MTLRCEGLRQSRCRQHSQQDHSAIKGSIAISMASISISSAIVQSSVRLVNRVQEKSVSQELGSDWTVFRASCNVTHEPWQRLMMRHQGLVPVGPKVIPRKLTLQFWVDTAGLSVSWME